MQIQSNAKKQMLGSSVLVFHSSNQKKFRVSVSKNKNRKMLLQMSDSPLVVLMTRLVRLLK